MQTLVEVRLVSASTRRVATQDDACLRKREGSLGVGTDLNTKIGWRNAVVLLVVVAVVVACCLLSLRLDDRRLSPRKTIRYAMPMRLPM